MNMDLPPALEEAPSLRSQMMDSVLAIAKTDCAVADQARTAIPHAKKNSSLLIQSETTSSNGLKRGFLLGGGQSTSGFASTPKTSSSLLISERKSKGSDPLMLNEVQQVMADAMPPMQKLVSDTQKWMTPELLAAVAGDPVLSSGMSNPRFMAAFAELQGKDPREAMLRFKDDAPLLAFLKKFMGLMGDHLVKLGGATAGEGVKDSTAAPLVPAKEDRERRVLIAEVLPQAVDTAPRSAHSDSALLPRSATIATSRESTSGKGGLETALGSGGLSTEEVVRAAESGRIAGSDAEVRAVLSNRELMAILSDPVIQHVMTECSKDGSKLSQFMRDRNISTKLSVLAKHGLIKIV